MSKYEVDENFFNKNTRQRSYVLGFFMSDGYLDSNGELGWYLGIKDLEILEKIKLELKSSHPINIHTSLSGRNKGRQYCRLRIKNKNIIESLHRLKIYPGPKTGKEFLPEECLKYKYDFFRGVFDGDGTVSHSKYNQIKSGARASVCSSSLLFLDSFRHHFNYGNVHESKSVSHWTVYDHNNLCDMYKKIYRNTDLFLRRKYDIFTDVVNHKPKR